MATQPERISSLENERLLIRSAIALMVAWTGWISVVVFNLSGDVRSLKQAAADGGNQHIVSNLLEPKSQEQLKANLGLVASQVRVAREEGDKPNSEKISKLSAAVDRITEEQTDLPEAWEAAAQLVSLKSNLLKASTANLPPCDMEHTSLQSKTVPWGNGGAIALFGYFYSKCVLNLEKLPPQNGPIVEPIYLDSGVVVYHGGPISSGNDMFAFTGCNFEMSVQNVPTAPIRQLLQAGLTQDNTLTLQTQNLRVGT